MRTILLTLAAMFLMGNTPVSAPSDEEISALINDGRASEAFAKVKSAASPGDPRLIEWLGSMYEDGLGVEPDLPTAIGYYRIAMGPKANYARWRMGVLIDEGKTQGTLQEAVGLFQAAADEGFVPGMVSLAVMQAQGRGTKLDYTAAMANYLRAAKAGNSHGVQGVGVLYARGEGVEKDLSQALAWFTLAMALGNEAGEAYFKQLSKDVPADEQKAVIARAQAIANELGYDINLILDESEETTEPGVTIEAEA